MTWTTKRRDELPPGWAKIRARIKRRDEGVCQWPLPYGGGICGAPGDGGVDHKVDPHYHEDDGLWLLCRRHHDRKTTSEATAGRAAAKQRST